MNLSTICFSSGNSVETKILFYCSDDEMKEIVGVEIFKRDIIGEILMNFLWRNIGTVNASLKT